MSSRSGWLCSIQINMGLKYVELSHGIASRCGDTIYYHKELPKYKKLYKQIIKHEKAHTNDFEWQDIMIDFRGKYLKGHKLEYYKFILTHPSSWTEFLPINRLNNQFTYNPTMIVVWIFIIVWLYFIVRIIFRL